MTDLLDRICSPDTRVDNASLETLLAAGEVLERVSRTGAPKVVRLAPSPQERLILKLWYPKGGFSSELLLHYATRFRRHAARLREKGVLAPDPCGWGRVDGTGIRFVCYPEIAGRTLREWIPDVDLDAAGGFVARLHGAGIDFRSLHMGNVLWSGEQQFALIDVTDCNFPWFMSRRRRLRRIAFFCGHRQEGAYLLANDNWRRFVSGYCRAARVAPEWMLERVALHLAPKPAP